MAILTVEELRDHVQSSLEDAALQLLLDAAEAAIVARAGPSGSRTEFFDGGGRFVTLARPASALGAITETPYQGTVHTMQADDYRVWPDGYSLERIPGGTNSRHRWRGLVSVTYTAADDTALRELVQIQLVQSDLNYNPGLTQQTIGTWSEAYANNATWHNADEWEAILSKLDTGVGMVVIGGGGQ